MIYPFYWLDRIQGKLMVEKFSGNLERKGEECNISVKECNIVHFLGATDTPFRGLCVIRASETYEYNVAKCFVMTCPSVKLLLNE